MSSTTNEHPQSTAPQPPRSKTPPPPPKVNSEHLASHSILKLENDIDDIIIDILEKALLGVDKPLSKELIKSLCKLNRGVLNAYVQHLVTPFTQYGANTVNVKNHCVQDVLNAYVKHLTATTSQLHTQTLIIESRIQNYFESCCQHSESKLVEHKRADESDLCKI